MFHYPKLQVLITAYESFAKDFGYCNGRYQD